MDSVSPRFTEEVTYEATAAVAQSLVQEDITLFISATFYGLELMLRMEHYILREFETLPHDMYHFQGDLSEKEKEKIAGHRICIIDTSPHTHVDNIVQLVQGCGGCIAAFVFLQPPGNWSRDDIPIFCLATHEPESSS